MSQARDDQSMRCNGILLVYPNMQSRKMKCVAITRLGERGPREKMVELLGFLFFSYCQTNGKHFYNPYPSLTRMKILNKRSMVNIRR